MRTLYPKHHFAKFKRPQDLARQRAGDKKYDKDIKGKTGNSTVMEWGPGSLYMIDATIAVTRPLRSIADLAVAESVSRDIIEQALIKARQRGLIPVREMAELRRRGSLPKWFDDLLMATK